MEVLESLETEKRQTDAVTKLLQIKTSLQQQLEEARQYQVHFSNILLLKSFIFSVFKMKISLPEQFQKSRSVL